MCLPEENGYPGFCTPPAACCDWETEEECYDDDYNPTGCAKVRLHGHVLNSQTLCGLTCVYTWIDL